MSDTKRSSSKNKKPKNNDIKKPKFDNEKRKKEIEENAKKQEKKEEQYKKLEAYISESGLTLAFNIIFAELISKQILPENFFSYTAMRLKQIGKEIKGMQTKISKSIEKPSEENDNNQNKNEEEESLLITQPKKK